MHRTYKGRGKREGWRGDGGEQIKYPNAIYENHILAFLNGPKKKIDSRDPHRRKNRLRTPLLMFSFPMFDRLKITERKNAIQAM